MTMPCDLTTVQADLCVSGIGKVTDPITLLQIIAQNTAEASGEADITPAAILARACTSGIGKVTSEITLLTVIAQNLCDAS